MIKRSFDPDWFSTPGDTLVELMGRKQLSTNELADRLKESHETVIGIMAGKIAITANMARQLESCVGGTKQFWLKRQNNYEQSLDRAANKISSSTADNWLNEFSSKTLNDVGLKKRGVGKEEALKSFLTFFGVTDPEDWYRRYANFPGDVVFRNTNSFETNKGALAIWLRLGELEALKITTKKYSSDKLRSIISHLRKMSRWKSPTDFIPAIRKMCAEAGVATVFIKAPVGCRASGASRFLSSEKAMIVLSFRYLSDDHFWFTFFHEIAHLLLHGQETTFVDEEETKKNRQEEEANIFASNALVPLHRHDELLNLRTSMNSVIRFAVSIGVSSGVVVGQLQHFGRLERNKLNYLKRRYNWQDIFACTL